MGYKYIGETNDSPGSELIAKLAEEEDERPIWVQAWGGGNTLAQAIWRVWKERTPEQLKGDRFVVRSRYSAGSPRPVGRARKSAAYHRSTAARMSSKRHWSGQSPPPSYIKLTPPASGQA